MFYSNYNDYLQSEEWDKKRQQRLVIDNFRCQMCHGYGTQRNPLQVHHITYRNIYKEDVFRDLVTLCRDCHLGIHHMMNRVTSEDGKHGWKDELPVANHVIDRNN